MWNENQGHGWKATACWKATKMNKPSTHSYGGSIFANSTCEDYTKVVCTGKYGSCDSTESWEYFHLNIQYWDLQWKRKKKLKMHKHTKARFNTSGALKHSTFQRSICCIPFPPPLCYRDLNLYRYLLSYKAHQRMVYSTNHASIKLVMKWGSFQSPEKSCQKQRSR